MSGSSQQVSTRRGVDKGSVAMYKFKEAQPVSARLLSHVRLNNAMTRLWVRAVGHNHLGCASQAVGTSISVGIRIFSIVEG